MRRCADLGRPTTMKPAVDRTILEGVGDLADPFQGYGIGRP